MTMRCTVLHSHDLSLFPIQSISLVLAGGGLAGLQLLEVPVANLHVAAVVVHALCELLRGSLAVVAPFLLLLRSLRLYGLRRGFG